LRPLGTGAGQLLLLGHSHLLYTKTMRTMTANSRTPARAITITLPTGYDDAAANKNTECGGQFLQCLSWLHWMLKLWRVLAQNLMRWQVPTRLLLFLAS